MSNIKLSVKINIEPTESEVSYSDMPEKSENGCFELIVDGQSHLNIDILENKLLHTNYPALREALAQHLGQESEKMALKKSQEWGKEYKVVRHDCDYRVDGEIGRFEFDLYDVKIDNRVVFESKNLFPLRKGKQWYLTCGFKEIALLNGVTERSYRQTTTGLNRCRYQEVGGTPLNTLRDGAESEGSLVLNFLEKKTERILQENHFTKEGLPKADCQAVIQTENSPPAQFTDSEVKKALVVVELDMQKRGFTDELIGKVNKTSLKRTYEKPTDTVNIHLDKVGAKKQKETRNSLTGKQKETHNSLTDDNKTSDVKKNKRSFVQNAVARIEHGKKGFTLTGSNISQVLLFVLGFLLNNHLICLHLSFFTDGERNLQDIIVSFFAWHTKMSLILDWYHLVKKFKEELSLACKGRKIRNQHLKELLRLLWFGLIDQAIDYLQKIPESDIKNADSVKKLIGYLERNRSFLPCYALRSQLKLPNSNNPVERTNNLVTSKRQKHQGMSWSKEGSHALTALSAVVLNNAVQPWVKNHEIPFEFVEKKAA